MTHSTDRNHITAYLKYLKKYKLALTFAFVLIPSLTAMNLVQPYLIKLGIDHYITQNDLPGLFKISTLFAGCVALKFIGESIQSYLFAYIGQKSVSELRRDLFKHILKLPPYYFDKTPLGSITSRITSDIETLNESIASGLVTLVGDLLTLVSIIVIMVMLSPTLTLATLLIVPILALIVNGFRIVLRDAFNEIRVLTGKQTAYLQEQLQGIKIIQLFGRQYQNLKDYKAINDQYKKVVIKSVVYDALLYSIVEALGSIVIACVIWVAFGRDYPQLISIGLVVAFIEYIRKFFAPLKELSTKFATLQHALAALEKIFSTFNTPTEKDTGTQKIISSEGKIEFKDVQFSYPGHEEKSVLKGLSFTLTPGSTIAIVGPSGSGKTTISKLMLRLYRPTKGTITLDGIDLEDYQLNELRHQFSTVTQDIYLLPDTVAYNIGFDHTGITQQDIETAAKAVDAHDFIMSLPNGYDTKISTSNSQLSQGQAQLITLARVLCSKAPIVLMDEATSSVDSIWEKKIEKAIQTILQKKSVLVIAHRLSTIQKADTILAMKDGEIIERGTHSQLMALQGFYYTLFNMQFNS